MMNMECLQMNKKVMKIWALMEIKADFQISLDLVTFGVVNKTLKALKVSLAISRNFLGVRSLKNQIDLKEERISFFIWNFLFKSQSMGQKGAFLIKFQTSAKLVKEQNPSQGLSQLNVKLVKEKELSIFVKDQCKFRWVALLVEGKGLLILILV